MQKPPHDWVVALVAVAGSLALNGMLLAYSYGQMEHRVDALEQQRAEMREEWRAARQRIEAAIKENAK